MFVRNSWHVVGFSEDFETDRLVPFVLMNEPIVIVRMESGLSALTDRCPHRFAPISSGRCEDGKIRCLYHGMLFSTDGRCVEIPGQDIIPETARIRSYRVVERGGWVMVWGGIADEADESLIPPFVPLDSADYAFGRGSIDYAASNALVNANLLDFTHLSYVHSNSFGADDKWAKLRPSIKRLASGVDVAWEVADQYGLGPEGGEPFRFDSRIHYQFLVPGHLIMCTEVHPLNDQPEADRPAKPMLEMHGQSVTAMTEKTCRYFFTWGVPAELPDASAAAEGRLTLAGAAFAEDRAIIEAQQRIIDMTPPSQQVMPTSADRAITIFERIMATHAAPQLQA